MIEAKRFDQKRSCSSWEMKMPEELAAAIGRRSTSAITLAISYGMPIVVGLLMPIVISLRSGPRAGKLTAANISAWTGSLLLLIGVALPLTLLFAKYATKAWAPGPLLGVHRKRCARSETCCF